MTGQNRSKDAVHRARVSLGERLLRDLLLDERAAGAGRTLARALQHHQDALLAGLSVAGTRGVADKHHGAWRSGNRYALPTSPHPRRRLLELRRSCATLTHQTAQKIGHSSRSSFELSIELLACPLKMYADCRRRESAVQCRPFVFSTFLICRSGRNKNRPIPGECGRCPHSKPFIFNNLWLDGGEWGIRTPDRTFGPITV